MRLFKLPRYSVYDVRRCLLSTNSILGIGFAQVRNFDLQLKWKELLVEIGENETPYIHGKTKEEAVTKYLVTITNEENGTEKVNKDSQPPDIVITAEGVKQMWKPEQQVPLSQVKLYEKYFGEKIKKGTSGKKKKATNKVKAAGPLKKRVLSVVVDKLLELIKLEEKKLELSAKKLQAGKSPSKIVADKKPEKEEPVILRFGAVLLLLFKYFILLYSSMLRMVRLICIKGWNFGFYECPLS